MQIFDSLFSLGSCFCQTFALINFIAIMFSTTILIVVSLFSNFCTHSNRKQLQLAYNSAMLSRRECHWRWWAVSFHKHVQCGSRGPNYRQSLHSSNRAKSLQFLVTIPCTTCCRQFLVTINSCPTLHSRPTFYIGALRCTLHGWPSGTCWLVYSHRTRFYYFCTSMEPCVVPCSLTFNFSTISRPNYTTFKPMSATNCTRQRSIISDLCPTSIGYS